jgi:serine/threonine protein kinase
VNDQTLTTAGFILGTPTHMAPEQCNGQPADHRSDLYSVGVVLYEMLTGKPPYTGETPLSLMRQIADMPFPNVRETLPDVSVEIAQIIETFVAKIPAERYQSGADASADLRAVIGGQSIPKRPISSPATRKAPHQDATLLVESLPAFQKVKQSARRAMIVGAVLALTFVLVLWGSIRIRRALVEAPAAAADTIEWESPEIPVYSSPFDEPVSEPEVAAIHEPLAPADPEEIDNSLPPELQDRVRTGSEPVAAEPEPVSVPASTAPEPTQVPSAEEVKTTVQKVNDVLKQVDQALGGDSGGGGKGKGKGKKK